MRFGVSARRRIDLCLGLPQEGAQCEMFIFLQLGIVSEDGNCEGGSFPHNFRVTEQIAEFQRRQSCLCGSQKIAGTSQAEVAFCDLKAVCGFLQNGELFSRALLDL